MRAYARVATCIWTDPDFLRLSLGAKALYLHLVTQADLQLTGVQPLRERRWSAQLGAPIGEHLVALEEAGFILVDRGTEEVWVKALMSFEGVLRQPNWKESAARSRQAILSQTILYAIGQRHPEVVEEWSLPTSPAGDDAVGDGVGDDMRDGVGTPSPQSSSLVSGIWSLVPGTSTPQDHEEKQGGTQGLALVKAEVVTEPHPETQVFEAWRDAGQMNGRAKLTEDRRRKIRARLREFPLEDVLDAARGIWESPWHVEQGQTDLALALRDGAHLERFRDTHRGLRVERAPLSRAERRLARDLQAADPELTREIMAEMYGGEG